MEVSSKKYPGKTVKRLLLIKGVQMPDLKTFTEILKTDSELCIKKYLAHFTLGEDGYDEEILRSAYETTKPLDLAEIFTQRFNNVEVRAAIISQVSPDAVFSAVKSKLIAEAILSKRYPRVKTFGEYGKPKHGKILEGDIEVDYIKRDEHYELFEITDKRLLPFLPWEDRYDINRGKASMEIYLLKMKCPSSNKNYYEYIGPDVFKNVLLKGHQRGQKNLGDISENINIIKAALAWQMRNQEGTPITIKQYDKIISET